MSFEIVLTLIVVLFLLIGMVKQVIEADLLALLAVSVLLLSGVLDTRELLSVFSNSAAMTVACMFILSAALDKTGVIDAMGKTTIRMIDRNMTLALISIFLMVFVASFFVNNTSVVLIMIPIIMMVAKKMEISPSKMLIPLSYISILGGVCTLIGTSTNLLVDGVAQNMGLRPFGMFDIFVPGLCMAAVGILYMLTIGRKILPARQTLYDAIDHGGRQKYIMQVTISPEAPLIGKTIAESGFTRADDFEVIQHIAAEAEKGTLANFLSKLDKTHIFWRHGLHKQSGQVAVNMQAVLKEGDRLILLSNQRNALTVDKLAGTTHENLVAESAVTMEALIPVGSRLIGQYVDQFNADEAQNVEIVAVHRLKGEISADFKTVRLSAGDTVLIKGDETVLGRMFADDQLSNLRSPAYEPYQKSKAPIAIAAIFAAIGLATFNILPIAGGAFIAAVLVMATQCIKVKDAYRALQGNVLLLIYAMLAVSIAMEKTGALGLIVDSIMGLAQGMPPFVIISIIYLLTSCITEVFSNNAAAVMLTPIAVGMAQSLGVDPVPFVVAIMFGASASFATPVGYQTNTLVFNAGGYKFVDFLRIGVPMNILMWLTASLIIPLYWGLL